VTTSFRVRALLMLAACLGAGWHGEAQSVPSGLVISQGPAPVHPGSVVPITLRSDRPLRAVEGTIFGRQVPFWSTGDAEWRALIGVDLEVMPGRYELRVSATDGRAVSLESVTAILVQDKAFATRRLRVADRFVEPPTELSARIARDAERLAAAFAGSTPDRLWENAFALPVANGVTSSFGRRTMMNGEPRGQHRGADFRAAVGEPVRAPNAGRVVLAGELYFTGLTVVVDHGLGLHSLVAHLSRIDVQEGEPVEHGTLLGLAGSTGRVTGPHLHWAVRLGDASVDPISLIAASAAAR